MKYLAVALCIFSFIPAVSAQEFEADSQANDFFFYMPRGWNRVERPDSTLLVAPLISPRMAYIALLPPVDLQPDLRTVFDTQWRGFLKDYRLLQGGETASQHSPKGYDSLFTAAVVSDRKRTSWVVFLMVAQNGTHAETLFYMSNVADRELASTLQTVLQQVIASIGFVNGAGDPRAAEAAKPVGLPKGKGKLNGIYRGLGTVSYGPQGQRIIGGRYVVFFPDGRFMEGFPDQGMDKLNEDTEIRRNPVGWGTYNPSGGPDGHGKITFLITDPNEKEPIIWDFKEYADHLQVNRDSYYLLEGCNDLKLEGTFRREDYKTLYAEGKRGIAFTLDGQFVDEGAFAAAGVLVRKPVGTGEDFDDGRPGRGTYRIANYTLELKFSDGRIKRTSIYRDPGASKEKAGDFYLNTYHFTRVQ
jgi:hypothetical protein